MIDELDSIKLEIADIKNTLSQKADLEKLENRVAQLERQLTPPLR